MLWDFRVSKNLGRFKIYFLLKNILDVNYEFEDGFPGPGREILIGFTWKN
jgi:outer membrane cobalamin receptor